MTHTSVHSKNHFHADTPSVAVNSSRKKFAPSQRAGSAESKAKMETQTDEPGCLETLSNTPTGPRPAADAISPEEPR
jgi:hypothetical protein